MSYKKKNSNAILHRKNLSGHNLKTRLTFMTNKGTIENDNVCICADTDETVIIKNEKEKLHTKANDLFKGYKLLVKIFS